MRMAILELEADAELHEHTYRAMAFYLVHGPQPLPDRVVDYLREVRDEALDAAKDLRVRRSRRGD